MLPPLQPLHQDSVLSKAKLEDHDKASTQQLVDSLKPGRQGSLKTRPDGIMIDGHHRIKILAIVESTWTPSARLSQKIQPTLK